MMVRHKAYARGALIGNPSDGYFGRTIALTFANFRADVVLYETPQLEILPNTRDHSRFGSIAELAEDVKRFGYYGGIRLLKASVRRFHAYCCARGLPLRGENFTLHYTSTIPHLVGLAGSSAIITACWRCLMDFYGVAIPKPVLANEVLAVERDDLGISAGLQDRVAQVYQGLVYMNFDRRLMESRGYGEYVYLDAAALPPLYVAYHSDLSQGSEVVHHNLRERFNRGDPAVLEAVAFWSDLTEQARAAIEARQGHRLGALFNANFDRRAALYDVGAGNRRMVETARSVGASAKFTGSGGAIIGTYEDEAMYQRLCAVMAPLQVQVLKPEIVPATGENGL